MSWDSDARRAELPSDWRIIRVKALERDGYRCRLVENGKRCNAYANQVDHIADPLDHSLENLQSLCARHHGKKTSREAQLSRYGLRRRRDRRFEPHPGMREVRE